jgi:hypothetical protein
VCYVVVVECCVKVIRLAVSALTDCSQADIAIINPCSQVTNCIEHSNLSHVGRHVRSRTMALLHSSSISTVDSVVGTSGRADGMSG